MDSRQLRYFVAMQDAGSLSGAAALEHVAVMLSRNSLARNA